MAVEMLALTSFLIASNSSKLKFACASKFSLLMLTTRPFPMHEAFHVLPWADLPSSHMHRVLALWH